MLVIEAGQVLSHYRVVERIGRGGMGEVYVAFDQTLERKVALKALRSDRRLTSEARERFLSEARTLSKLDHPNICLIYDHFEAGNRDFLVLELIDGVTLRDALLERMDRSRALRIARQICDVLVAAHAAGIVHRDLKPENIMLTAADEVKVLDFGLARAHAPPLAAEPESHSPSVPSDGAPEAEAHPDDASETPTVMASPRAVRTRAGALMGTVAYMSPEQARGLPATPASDMFALGLILHEMVTGQTAYPLREEPDALLPQVAEARTRPVTGARRDFAELIARLESPAPSRRPTAVETLDRLTWMLDRPKRRIRRLVAAAILAAVGLAGLKYTIDLGRERAVAERRRDQAESLIEFMLGDLREKLAPVGRLDVLDDVGDKALEYFAAVPETEITDADLGRRSKALYQIGEVRMSQGNLRAAQKAFEQSLNLATGLAARDANNGEWQLGLATSHFWVGYAHLKQQRLDDALEQFRAYQAIAERLAALEPERTDYQRELGYAHSNIAQVLEAQGKLPQALRSYVRGKEVEERLAARFPDQPSYRIDLAGSHNTIGDVLAREGKLAGAREQFLAERAILKALVAEDARNTNYRELLARSDNYLGRVLLSLGRTDEAIEVFEEAVRLLEALVGIDPTHANRQRSLAVGRFRLATALRIARRPAAGSDLLRASETTARALALEDPADWAKQQDLVRVLLYEAEVRLDDGDVRDARAKTREVFEILERVSRDHPDAPDLRHLVGMAHMTMARVAPPTEARASWARAFDLLGPLVADSNDPQMLDPRARALILGGRLEEARPIVRKLRAMGYARADFSSLCEAHGVVE